MKASGESFDRAYYQRFYENPKTRVTDAGQTARLADFVCSYLRYLELPVRRVLDLGCGVGLWQPALRRHYPNVHYQGVEFSAYLCERYGWEQGSVVDYRAKQPFDLVVCQGVLPYLEDRAGGGARQNQGGRGGGGGVRGGGGPTGQAVKPSRSAR
jgi:2-polyprenyl-3-methyl-5-hydroxy-6-metoxy-1,4-benzoquinol methylase